MKKSSKLKSKKNNKPINEFNSSVQGEVNYLSNALTRAGHANLKSGNAIKLLINGKETYQNWLQHIEKAQKWIHLENYIFNDDVIGNEFANVLIKKSTQGVKVRVLYDWFGSYKTSRRFWSRMRKAGIEVRAVSPLSIKKFLNLFNRDHRKFIGIDGTYASVGGLCIGDDWLEVFDNHLPYRDTAVAISGPAVLDLEEAFAHIWEKFGPELPIEERISVLENLERVGEYDIRVIKQAPGKMRILKLLEFVMGAAQKRIWITDAYFIAIPSLKEVILNAAKDGVDIRILLPANNDIHWIGTVSRVGYRELLEAGVKIWEYPGPMMHAKTTIVDGWWSRIGSTNLNISSLLLNWELDIVVESRDFGMQMERIFERDLKDAIEIVLDDDHVDDKVKVRPTRKLTRKEKLELKKDAKRNRGSGPKIFNTARRATAMAIKSGSTALKKHERKVSFALSVCTLALAGLIFFVPKIVSYSVASILVLLSLGGIFNMLMPLKKEN